MPGIIVFSALVLVFCLVPITGVQADNSTDSGEADAVSLDEVILKNGSRILGKVISARDGVIVIETDFSEAIKIKVEKY